MVCPYSPRPSVLAVMRMPGRPGAPSDESKGAGSNPPDGVGTTPSVDCLRWAAVVVDGALRWSEC